MVQRPAFRPLMVVLLVAAAQVLAAPASNAATLSRTALTATVSGSMVTASTVIRSSPTASATAAGICARNAAWHNFDFTHTPATLTAAGTTLTRVASFPAGTYTYWACALIDGVWNDIGARQTFTVAAAAAVAVGPTMPVGNLAGWRQVFADDFTAPLAAGSFPGSYSSRWTSYHGFRDTFGIALYDRSAISVHDGTMDLHLRTLNGTPTGAAPVPVVTTAWAGQTYGRYSVRFRSDPLPGYKAAWLLWPTSDNWNQGEIDFPEGGLDSTMWGFNHCLNDPSTNCYWVDTKTTFTDWHIVTVEWSPGRITYLLDGRTVGTTSASVPTAPMRWVLQTESDGRVPAASVAGHVLIDWVTIYAWTG